jgi:hypothetical protein
MPRSELQVQKFARFETAVVVIGLVVVECLVILAMFVGAHVWLRLSSGH